MPLYTKGSTLFDDYETFGLQITKGFSSCIPRHSHAFCRLAEKLR